MRSVAHLTLLVLLGCAAAAAPRARVPRPRAAPSAPVGSERPVAGVPGTPDTLAVTGRHVCFLDADSGVRCWGSIGRWAIDGWERGYRPRPVRIPGVSGATRISPQPDGVCVVHGPGGRLSCWGDGRPITDLGVGVSDIDGGHRTCVVRQGGVACLSDGALVPVPALTDAVEVMTLPDGACALRSDGRVTCIRGDEARAIDAPETTTFVSFDARPCAVATDRRVVCWTPDHELAVERPELRGTTGGGRHVVHDSGRVFRVVDAGPSLELRPVVDLEGAIEVRSHPGAGTGPAAQADERACARRRDGSVACWGARGPPHAPRLGDGIASARFEAERVAGLTGAHLVRAGGARACAVHGPERHLSCWGRNDRGEVGDGGRRDRATPARVGDLRDVVDVALRDGESCALLEGGRVSCWGDPGPGPGPGPRPGPGPGPGPGAGTMPAGHAVRAPEPVPGVEGVDLLYASGGTLCLGRGRDVGCTDVAPLLAPPAPAAALSGATTLFGDRPCAIGAGGRVRCRSGRSPVRAARALFGDERRGCALSPSGDVACWDPEHGRQALEPPGDVVAIAGRGATVTMLTSDAEVWTWGTGFGEPARVGGLDAVTQLGQGDAFACAVHDDGGVSCWGSRAHGALGDGTRSVEDRAVTVYTP